MTTKPTPPTPPATLAQAMAAAFGEIESATKSANNPHFKTKYADLTSVIEAIKPALVANGLFFTQSPRTNPAGAEIETILHHASGEHFSLGTIFVPADRNNAQAFGSALTYARRYALVTAFGVPVEDDDGNAAASAPPRQKEEAPALITDAQLTELQMMFTHLGVPVAEFLKVAKIATLDKLPANWFERAKKWVNDKAAEKRQSLADELGDGVDF
jgi:hypothetical protein